jgi:hypothetical protein
MIRRRVCRAAEGGRSRCQGERNDAPSAGGRHARYREAARILRARADGDGLMLVAGEGKRLVAVKFGVTASRSCRPSRSCTTSCTVHARAFGQRARWRSSSGVSRGQAHYVRRRADLSHVTPFRRDVLLECARIRAAPSARTATWRAA